MQFSVYTDCITWLASWLPYGADGERWIRHEAVAQRRNYELCLAGGKPPYSERGSLADYRRSVELLEATVREFDARAVDNRTA